MATAQETYEAIKTKQRRGLALTAEESQQLRVASQELYRTRQIKSEQERIAQQQAEYKKAQQQAKKQQALQDKINRYKELIKKEATLRVEVIAEKEYPYRTEAVKLGGLTVDEQAELNRIAPEVKKAIKQAKIQTKKQQLEYQKLDAELRAIDLTDDEKKKIEDKNPHKIGTIQYREWNNNKIRDALQSKKTETAIKNIVESDLSDKIREIVSKDYSLALKGVSYLANIDYLINYVPDTEFKPVEGYGWVIHKSGIPQIGYTYGGAETFGSDQPRPIVAGYPEYVEKIKTQYEKEDVERNRINAERKATEAQENANKLAKRASISRVEADIKAAEKAQNVADSYAVQANTARQYESLYSIMDSKTKEFNIAKALEIGITPEFLETVGINKNNIQQAQKVISELKNADAIHKRWQDVVNYQKKTGYTGTVFVSPFTRVESSKEILVSLPSGVNLENIKNQLTNATDNSVKIGTDYDRLVISKVRDVSQAVQNKIANILKNVGVLRAYAAPPIDDWRVDKEGRLSWSEEFAGKTYTYVLEKPDQTGQYRKGWLIRPDGKTEFHNPSQPCSAGGECAVESLEFLNGIDLINSIGGYDIAVDYVSSGQKPIQEVDSIPEPILQETKPVEIPKTKEEADKYKDVELFDIYKIDFGKLEEKADDKNIDKAVQEVESKFSYMPQVYGYEPNNPYKDVKYKDLSVTEQRDIVKSFSTFNDDGSIKNTKIIDAMASGVTPEFLMAMGYKTEDIRNSQDFINEGLLDYRIGDSYDIDKAISDGKSLKVIENFFGDKDELDKTLAKIHQLRNDGVALWMKGNEDFVNKLSDNGYKAYDSETGTVSLLVDEWVYDEHEKGRSKESIQRELEDIYGVDAKKYTEDLRPDNLPTDAELRRMSGKEFEEYAKSNPDDIRAKYTFMFTPPSWRDAKELNNAANDSQLKRAGLETSKLLEKFSKATTKIGESNINWSDKKEWSLYVNQALNSSLMANLADSGVEIAKVFLPNIRDKSTHEVLDLAKGKIEQFPSKEKDKAAEDWWDNLVKDDYEQIKQKLIDKGISEKRAERIAKRSSRISEEAKYTGTDMASFIFSIVKTIGANIPITLMQTQVALKEGETNKAAQDIAELTGGLVLFPVMLVGGISGDIADKHPGKVIGTTIGLGLTFIVGPETIVKTIKTAKVRANPRMLSNSAQAIEMHLMTQQSKYMTPYQLQKLTQDLEMIISEAAIRGGPYALKTARDITYRAADGTVSYRVAPVERYVNNNLVHISPQAGKLLSESFNKLNSVKATSGYPFGGFYSSSQPAFNFYLRDVPTSPASLRTIYSPHDIYNPSIAPKATIDIMNKVDELLFQGRLNEAKTLLRNSEKAGKLDNTLIYPMQKWAGGRKAELEWWYPEGFKIKAIPKDNIPWWARVKDENTAVTYMDSPIAYKQKSFYEPRNLKEYERITQRRRTELKDRYDELQKDLKAETDKGQIKAINSELKSIEPLIQKDSAKLEYDAISEGKTPPQQFISLMPPDKGLFFKDNNWYYRDKPNEVWKPVTIKEGQRIPIYWGITERALKDGYGMPTLRQMYKSELMAMATDIRKGVPWNRQLRSKTDSPYGYYVTSKTGTKLKAYKADVPKETMAGINGTVVKTAKEAIDNIYNRSFWDEYLTSKGIQSIRPPVPHPVYGKIRYDSKTGRVKIDGAMRTRVEIIPITEDGKIIMAHAYADNAPKDVFSFAGGGLHVTSDGSIAVRGGVVKGTKIESFQPEEISLTYGNTFRSAALQQLKEELGLIGKDTEYLGISFGKGKDFGLPGFRVFTTRTGKQTVDLYRYLKKGVERAEKGEIIPEIDNYKSWNPRGNEKITVYPDEYYILEGLSIKYPELKINMKNVKIFKGDKQYDMSRINKAVDKEFAQRIRDKSMPTEEQIRDVAAIRERKRYENKIKTAERFGEGTIGLIPYPLSKAVMEVYRGEIGGIKIPRSDNSLYPNEVANAKLEMGTLKDYGNVEKGEWLGKGTKYWNSSVYNKIINNESVTIYRAVPKDVTNIHSGAYVTQSKEYAQLHLDSVYKGQGHILEGKAKASELIAVNPNEFYYAPKIIKELLESEEGFIDISKILTRKDEAKIDALVRKVDDRAMLRAKQGEDYSIAFMDEATKVAKTGGELYELLEVESGVPADLLRSTGNTLLETLKKQKPEASKVELRNEIYDTLQQADRYAKAYEQIIIARKPTGKFSENYQTHAISRSRDIPELYDIYTEAAIKARETGEKFDTTYNKLLSDNKAKLAKLNINIDYLIKDITESAKLGVPTYMQEYIKQGNWYLKQIPELKEAFDKFNVKGKQYNQAFREAVLDTQEIIRTKYNLEPDYILADVDLVGQSARNAVYEEGFWDYIDQKLGKQVERKEITKKESNEIYNDLLKEDRKRNSRRIEDIPYYKDSLYPRLPYMTARITIADIASKRPAVKYDSYRPSIAYSELYQTYPKVPYPVIEEQYTGVYPVAETKPYPTTIPVGKYPPVPEADKYPAVPTIKTGKPIPVKPPPFVPVTTKKFPPLLLNETKEQYIDRVFPGAIAWKQGWIYKMIWYPYGKREILNTKKPIPGVRYHTGAKSAYLSVVKKGQYVPNIITRDMGIMDLRFETPSRREGRGKKGKISGRPRIYYKPDVEQKTKTTGISTAR